MEENLFFGHMCWGPITTCITIVGADLEECLTNQRAKLFGQLGLVGMGEFLGSSPATMSCVMRDAPQ